MNTLLAFLLVSKGRGDLAQPVSVTIPASRIQVVIDQLAKLSGERLEVAPAMTPDVVLVSVKDMPLSTLMKKIAKVCSAEWTESKGIWRLGPAASVRQREEQDEISRRINWIRAAIEIPKTDHVLEGVAKKSTASLKNADEMPPSIRLLLRSLPPLTLAKMSPGDRIVISSSPTRMQTEFPFPIAPLINAVIEENNQTYDETETDDEPNVIPLWNKPKRIAFGQIGRLEASIKRPLDQPYHRAFELGVQISVYDRAGKVLDEIYNHVYASPSGSIAPQPPSVSRLISLTPQASALYQLTTALRATIASGTFESTLPLLLNPTIYDPLSFHTSEALLQTYATDKRSLVACLGDSSLAIGWGSAITTSRVREQVGSHTYLVELTDLDGTLLKPAFPYIERRMRANRRELEIFLRRSRTQGLVSLPLAARVDYTVPFHETDPYLAGYFRLAPGFLRYRPRTPWSILFGSLTLAQQDALLRGGRIPISHLNSQALKWVSLLTFGSLSNPGFGPFPRPSTAGDSGFFEPEATDLLPDGLPADAYLTAAHETEPALLVPEGSESLGLSRVEWIDQIAETLESKQSKVSDLVDPKKRFQMINVTTIELAIVASPNLYFSGLLTDLSRPTNAPKVSLNDLPADFQKRLEAARQAIRRRGED